MVSDHGPNHCIQGNTFDYRHGMEVLFPALSRRKDLAAIAATRTDDEICHKLGPGERASSEAHSFESAFQLTSDCKKIQTTGVREVLFNGFGTGAAFVASHGLDISAQGDSG